jgi:hypothetical protein
LLFGFFYLTPLITFLFFSFTSASAFDFTDFCF